MPNLVHLTLPHSENIGFNIIFPSAPIPPPMSHFLFRFLEYNFDCISYPFHACYMFCNNIVLKLIALVTEHEFVRPSVTLL